MAKYIALLLQTTSHLPLDIPSIDCIYAHIRKLHTPLPRTHRQDTATLGVPAAIAFRIEYNQLEHVSYERRVH